MRILILSIIFLSTSSSSIYLYGQRTIGKEIDDNHSSIIIANSQERTFHSNIYDDKITLQIYLPSGYYETDTTFSKYPNLQMQTKKSYPVLYLLDSDIYFGMATVISQLLQWENKLPGLIIVGVSYGLSDWYGERQYNYFPFPDSSFKVPGDASKYLEMQEKELIPFIESNFRTDTNHRIIFGHSAGGIFALYSLFSNPNLFQGYIVASPWKKYVNKYFFNIERDYFAKRDTLPAKLYLSMGEFELNDLKPEWEKFVGVLNKRNYKDLTMKTVFIEDESHLSVVPIVFVKSLQWYFSTD